VRQQEARGCARKRECVNGAVVHDAVVHDAVVHDAVVGALTTLNA
jgi:hypothetical protein